jgi:hypothetical protein
MESQNFPWFILLKGRPFQGIILRKSKLLTDYTAERHAFARYNLPKGMPISSIIRGKACNRKLFSIKVGFSTVKCAESFAFFRTILRKEMPFRKIICDKSKLSANHTVEKHASPQDNPRKVKTYWELSGGKFEHTRKVKISLFKAYLYFYR